MVVKPPDDQAVLFNERPFLGQYGVSLAFGEFVGFIEMTEERWLMRDDQIISRSRRAL